MRPLTVISIDELEELLPRIAAGVEWRDLFAARFQRDDVKMTSISQEMVNLLLAAGKTEEEVFNEHLRARFRKFFPDFVPRSERSADGTADGVQPKSE